jgi:uncharacterized membrane protein YidH (DUF202 family)
MPDRPQDLLDRAGQHERTALAWDRTALLMILVGALALRTGDLPWRAVLHAPAVAALLLGAVMLAHAYRRYLTTDERVRAGQPVASPRLLQAVAVVAVAVSAAAGLLIVTGG